MSQQQNPEEITGKIKLATEVLGYLKEAQGSLVALGLTDQSALVIAARLIDLGLEDAEFERDNIPQRSVA